MLSIWDIAPYCVFLCFVLRRVWLAYVCFVELLVCVCCDFFAHVQCIANVPCLLVCLLDCSCVGVFVCLTACLHFFLHIMLLLWLPVCLFAGLRARWFVCLLVCWCACVWFCLLLSTNV